MAHQLSWELEPGEAAALRSHADRGERVHSTQAQQPYDCLGVRRAGYKLGERAFRSSPRGSSVPIATR